MAKAIDDLGGTVYLSPMLEDGETSQMNTEENVGGTGLAKGGKAAKRRQYRMTEEQAEKLVPKHKRHEEEGQFVARARSMVTMFDDGTVISLEGFKACHCPLHGGAILPMSEFGYRRMANGIIRPQAQCKKGR